MNINYRNLAAIVSLILIAACNNQSRNQMQNNADKESDSRYRPKPYVELNHPEWSRNATIYGVNIRQYTPEGTFKAFEPHLALR